MPKFSPEDLYLLQPPPLLWHLQVVELIYYHSLYPLYYLNPRPLLHEQ
jgi:hypothetical protein